MDTLTNQALETTNPGTPFLRDAPNGLRSIDLFAGGGGTALGLDHAGFDHALLVERDKNACATLRHNRPQWDVRCADVSEVDFTPYRGTIDLVEAGFPCQAFSYAGTGGGFADTRGTMFFQFARAIEEVLPKVFVGENVKGLLSHDKGRTFEVIKRKLASITDPETGVGYSIAYRVVSSQKHGVPQKRDRLIIIGVRDDVGSRIFFPADCQQIFTVRDALHQVPVSEGQQYSPSRFAVLDQVPEGKNWRALPMDALKAFTPNFTPGVGGGCANLARRLAWGEPSPTLTCSPSQKLTERCHPSETRPLTVREYARIQTFPDTWAFPVGMTAAYKQIGNAVPVNIGFYLGKCVERIITGAPNSFSEPALVSEYIQ